MLDAVTVAHFATPCSSRIRERILDGELALRRSLRADRELRSSVGVDRNALREALKRLQQLRLVAIDPGGSTRCSTSPPSGLDLLGAILFSGQR